MKHLKKFDSKIFESTDVNNLSIVEDAFIDFMDDCEGFEIKQINHYWFDIIVPIDPLFRQIGSVKQVISSMGDMSKTLLKIKESLLRIESHIFSSSYLFQASGSLKIELKFFVHSKTEKDIIFVKNSMIYLDEDGLKSLIMEKFKVKVLHLEFDGYNGDESIDQDSWLLIVLKTEDRSVAQRCLEFMENTFQYTETGDYMNQGTFPIFDKDGGEILGSSMYDENTRVVTTEILCKISEGLDIP